MPAFIPLIPTILGPTGLAVIESAAAVTYLTSGTALAIDMLSSSPHAGTEVISQSAAIKAKLNDLCTGDALAPAP